jgi:hypothetical protein
MPRMILIDEFHLVITVRQNLTEAAAEAIRQTLDSKRFQTDLQRTVRRAFWRYSPLRRTHVKLAR